MFSKFRIGLILIFMLLLMQACATNAGFENNAAEIDDEPVAEEPDDSETLGPFPTQTMAPAVTDLPTTGGEAEPTPIAISMDLNTVYARVVEELPKGSALFSPPETMRVGETKLVEVRVVPMTGEEIEEDDQIRATLTANLDQGDGADEVLVIPLRVSTVMSARLTGNAFKIEALTAEEQIRTSDDLYLSWIWEVTPQRAGEQRLTLYLSVVVNAEGLGDKTHTTDEVRSVQVEANPFYSIRLFFGTNWEWVATGLLLPALGWGYRKLRGSIGR